MARRVTGDRETARAFRQLAKFVSVPTNSASRFALRPMLAEAKRNAPKRSGLLKKSLGIKRDTRSPKLRPVHWIGPLARFKDVFRYAHLTNFGHLNRDGSVTVGTRWMDRAFEATKDEVVRRFGDRIGTELEKRAARVRAK